MTSNLISHNEYFPIHFLEDLNATPKLKSDFILEQANQILKDGWTRWGHTLNSLKPPIDWHSSRGSFDHSLHSWEPLTIIIPAYEHSRDPRHYELILGFVSDWLEQVQVPLLPDPSSAIRTILSSKGSAAWYDMSVGQRIYRLAYVLDLVSTMEPHRSELIENLEQSLAFHHALLCEEAFFKPHSNHGVYQALGQLAAAGRFYQRGRYREYHHLAVERVRKLTGSQFSKSGVHLEHSPGYHYMVLGSYLGAVASGVVNDESTLTALSGAEEALAWMVMPNGMICPFGDTDPRRIVSGDFVASRHQHDELKYIVSGGTLGTAPIPKVRAYIGSGYAFARLYAPGVESKFGNASYLAQIAAFHSRTHKHADHLSFIWHDRGRDILIDPGRYAYAGRTEIGTDLFNQGFWYSDPKRIYVESTRAHNCVEIDGKSYPRRNVKPFGSALRYAGEQDGLAVTDCDLVHERTIRHRRILIMRPGHFLMVVDWLNDRGKAHDYRQWFQFAPDWHVEAAGDGYQARIAALPGAGYESEQGEALTVINLIEGVNSCAPVRGQTEPELQGWMSDAAYSLIPSASIKFEALHCNMARFATLFVFGETVEIDSKATRFNATLRNGSVVWTDARGKHHLALAAGEPGTVTMTFKSG